MIEPDDEPRAQELTQEELQDLLGELGQQMNVEQLRLMLELVNSCEDLEEAQAALEQISRAA